MQINHELIALGGHVPNRALSLLLLPLLSSLGRNQHPLEDPFRVSVARDPGSAPDAHFSSFCAVCVSSEWWGWGGGPGWPWRKLHGGAGWVLP